MRTYTVHWRPAAASPDRDAVVVKDGFAWGVFAVLAIVLDALAAPFGPEAEVVALAAAVLVACHANDWRRAWLYRRGYAERLVTAEGRAAALRRFAEATLGRGY